MAIDTLRRITNANMTIQEFNLQKEIGLDYWHTCLISPDGTPFSSGFAKDRNVSRKIAFAELIERQEFRRIKENTSLHGKWGINLVPTACGFAAGFDYYNTVHRSVGEALERWVMSKWIDNQYYLERKELTEVEESLDKVSHWFFDQFDEVLFFERDFVIGFSGNIFKFKIGQTMGLLDCGIFPGSSAQFGDGSVWQHALLESYRHFLITKNNKPLNKFPDNKVRYFAKNADIALAQIGNAYKNEWPLPKVLFHHSEELEESGMFLSRTIIEGWKSWHLGPIERFLY